MFVEYALVPDIFDASSYQPPELGALCLQMLRPIALDEALVRDLRGGEWGQYIQDWLRNAPTTCHPKAKELLKKIKVQKRLRSVAFCSPNKPQCHADWCEEAIDSCSHEELAGIVASEALARQYRQNPIVTSIDKLSNDDWMKKRSATVELRKQSSDYLRHLKLLLNHANSILFIDPYLDPIDPKYQEFHFFLDEAAKRTDLTPQIEIHVATKGSDREGLGLSEWRTRFQTLSGSATTDLDIEIFLWKYFHDRYIISDMGGIGLSNGLDVIPDPNATATWSRLSRDLRDSVQSNFSENSAKYQLLHRFSLN
jgi:hypothetical protein